MLGLTFISSLIVCVRYSLDIAIKHKSGDLKINLDKQIPLFIQIDREELSKINASNNITKLSCDEVNQDFYLMNITQNCKLSPNINTRLYCGRSTLLFSEEDVYNMSYVSGLCFILKSEDLQWLKSVRPFIRNVELDNGKLSLSLFYTKVDDKIQDIKYVADDFRDALMAKVIDGSTTKFSKEMTVYDVVALYILHTGPLTVADDNSWFNTTEGKITTSFFKIFNSELSIPEEDETLKLKIKCVREYLNTHEVEPDDESSMYIFDKIKCTYMDKSCERNQYAFLHKEYYYYDPNAYVSDNNLSTLIRAYIQYDELFKYICAIAAYYSNDRDDTKTNSFIRGIFSSIGCADVVNVFCYYMKHQEKENASKIMKYDNVEDINVSDIFDVLGIKEEEVSVDELVAYAKTYIMNFCKKRMLFSVGIDLTLNMRINDVIMFNGKTKTTDLVVQSVDSYGSAPAIL